MSFIVSLYESLFRPRAALHELSGQELVELLTTPQRVFNITDKRTLPMWSPVRLSPSYRRKDNVVCASCRGVRASPTTPMEDSARGRCRDLCISR